MACDGLSYSRLATHVIAHVTCLPTKLLGESGQQITLSFLPSGWISHFCLIIDTRTANFSDNLTEILF